MVRRIAAFQGLGDLLLGPISDPRRRDIRKISDTFRVGAAGEARLPLDASKKISRRMALSAMRCRFNQILAAVPLAAAIRTRYDRFVIKIQKFPEADKTPDLKDHG